MNIIPRFEEIISEEESASIYLVKLRNFLALWREDVKGPQRKLPNWMNDRAMVLTESL